jgi:hypothetical protein
VPVLDENDADESPDIITVPPFSYVVPVDEPIFMVSPFIVVVRPKVPVPLAPIVTF